jgi:hypothetical protein
MRVRGPASQRITASFQISGSCLALRGLVSVEESADGWRVRPGHHVAIFRQIIITAAFPAASDVPINPEIICFSCSASHTPCAFLGDKIKIDYPERSRALPAP